MGEEERVYTRNVERGMEKGRTLRKE